MKGQTWIVCAALVLALTLIAYVVGLISVGPAMIIALCAFLVAFEIDNKMKKRNADGDANG